MDRLRHGDIHPLLAQASSRSNGSLLCWVSVESYPLNEGKVALPTKLEAGSSAAESHGTERTNAGAPTAPQVYVPIPRLQAGLDPGCRVDVDPGRICLSVELIYQIHCEAS